MQLCCKAEKLIREQLSSSPSPDLWCVLGGLTGDEAHLHRAWADSGGSCARAMRDLARMEMKRGDTEAAIQHMRAALDLNPLRPHDWFVLGVASQKVDRCVRACVRCCCLWLAWRGGVALLCRVFA